MSATSSPQKFVRCPQCSQRLGVRDADAGRMARCGGCSRLFQIELAAMIAAKGAGAPSAQAQAPPGQGSALEDDGPQIVTFECELCQTRITTRAADAGRKVKCPDCGRKNTIPKPEKPKAKAVPAAFTGEQYELWGVDDRPWDASASPPPSSTPLHSVRCRLCETLMYATDEQIGRELRCPDCGARTIAKRTVKPPPVQLPALAGFEYQLDPASAPAPRPVPVPIAIRDAELHAHARATTVGPDGRLIVQKLTDVGRPKRPPIPLLQGVWRMLATQEIIARWVMTSILFGIASWLVIDSLLTPVQSIAAIAGIALMVMGMGMTILWLTFAAPTFIAIVSESAEGQDRLHDPPGWSPMEWLGDAVFLITWLGAAGLAGAAASWGLSSLAGGAIGPEYLVIAGLAAALVVFPLVLLGSLLENTAFGIISPRLLATLLRHPGPWALFYVETYLLAAAATAACFGLFVVGPPGVFAAPLVIMGALVVYMRLAGRLAWWLGDLTDVIDQREEIDDAAAAHPHLAAARAQARQEART